MVERYLVVGAGRACLTTTNQTLDGAHLDGIHVAVLLLSQESLDILVHLLDDLILVVDKQLVEAIDEVHEASHLLVVDGDVARCLVADMHVVTLVDEALDGSAHRDDIVVRVR